MNTLLNSFFFFHVLINFSSFKILRWYSLFGNFPYAAFLSPAGNFHFSIIFQIIIMAFSLNHLHQLMTTMSIASASTG